MGSPCGHITSHVPRSVQQEANEGMPSKNPLSNKL